MKEKFLEINNILREGKLILDDEVNKLIYLKSTELNLVISFNEYAISYIHYQYRFENIEYCKRNDYKLKVNLSPKEDINDVIQTLTKFNSLVAELCDYIITLSK